MAFPAAFYEHLFVLPGGKNTCIQAPLDAPLDEWGFRVQDDG